jgi:hypothetical protein
MKDTILSIIRHGLTIAGGVLVTKGYIADTTSLEVAGALAAAIGGLWGAIDEYRAAAAAKKAEK